ncbi:MAG: hypothetical protein IKK53_03725 [Ruminiclostridium sp.]|nr:hypothetical protein [Ruminiclostridium sp.]
MAEKNKKAKKETVKPLKPVFASANIIYSAVFFGAVTVAMLALPRPEKSLIEQRTLATFPEFTYEDFINGKYTNGITEFYDDTVPYRDDIKKIAAGIKGLYGVELNDTEIHGQLVAITTEEEELPVVAPVTTESTTTTADEAAPSGTTAVTTAPVTTTTVTTEKNINEIADGVITNGQVVVKRNDGHYWAISLFGGGKGKTYASALNRFHEELGEDVKIYTMIAPTAGEYYLPSNFADYNAIQKNSVDSIASQLDEDIVTVDAISALAEHTDEDIYLRTDHHWQPLGAYYAAEAFAKAADVPFADISTYEKVVKDGYVGTMYAFTESVNILNDPEQFVFYKPSNKYYTYYYDTAYNFDYEFPLFVDMPVGSSYSTFMGGDMKIVRIETDVKNGRKLLIFKDSYGNAEVPFYTGSFEEIYVCDMRYFDLNAIEFIKENGITDLLFTMCTFSATGPNANGLNIVLDNPTREELEAMAATATTTTAPEPEAEETTKKTKKTSTTTPPEEAEEDEPEVTTVPEDEPEKTTKKTKKTKKTTTEAPEQAAEETTKDNDEE